MKPIILHGHERSITQIKYNREGDLLFSSAKDNKPTVWYSINGERLGTYNGHNGAVWCLDPSWDCKYLLTGAADNSSRIWDIETGALIKIMGSPSPVRSCGFSYSGQQFFFTNDSSMGQTSKVMFYNVNDVISGEGTPEPYLTIPCPDKGKITSAIWGPLDAYVIIGCDDGTINKLDAKTGELLKTSVDHTAKINDLQKSVDEMMFISASKDNNAKLFDMETFEVIKTYKTDRPVNSASLSPSREHVITGGGQEAMEVTTTSSKVGKFDAKFFHMIFEEEIGRVKGHFGPINSMAFNPEGKSYASGGEDGFIRNHVFDKSYFEFEFEY
jgi:translation initiation factor 3 subunit I